MNEMKGKYLITADNWFYAPDGRLYRAVWGEVEILSDGFLGVKTNMRSSNWFAKVGSKDKFVLLAGCQIHYAVKCPKKPPTGDVLEYKNIEKDTMMIKTPYYRESQIWIAE